jgi:Zn-dependent peptidase ImmA (M78 family)
LANRIRNLLKVTDNVQRSWRNEDEAFDQWCRNCELAGVFVLQSSDVALEEMRGFALPDRFAPALLVNSRDSRAAQIFTLLHEFAHLLIGAEGVSNLDIPRKATTDEDRTEVFCNALAAETLLPSGLFEEEWRGLQVHDLDEAIQRAAKTFRVSREVVARRLRNLKVLSEEEYLERRERYGDEFARTRQTRTGFLPYLQRVLRDNGNAFTRLVLSAYGDERITGRDVSHLLRVKLNHLGQIETHAFAI